MPVCELAKRSRGTPRVAKTGMLRRARDFAQVEGNGTITLELDQFALDRLGMMKLDLMPPIAKSFTRSQTSLMAVQWAQQLSTALGEESDTISEKYEPFLIMKGFMQRTQQGRNYSPRTTAHQLQRWTRQTFLIEDLFTTFVRCQDVSRRHCILLCPDQHINYKGIQHFLAGFTKRGWTVVVNRVQ